MQEDVAILVPENPAEVLEEGYGYIRLAPDYAHLYGYELSYKGIVRARRYAVPVLERGRLAFAKGASGDEAIAAYNDKRSQGCKDAEAGLAEAQKHLAERHGFLNLTEKWTVTKWVDLGPIAPNGGDRDFVEGVLAMFREGLR
jgi:hypothetical protein